MLNEYLRWHLEWIMDIVSAAKARFIVLAHWNQITNQICHKIMSHELQQTPKLCPIFVPESKADPSV